MPEVMLEQPTTPAAGEPRQPLPIDPAYREIARPIVDDALVDVPATPLFVNELPIVDRIMDYTVGTDTRGRTTETLVKGSTDLARDSYKHSQQLRKGEIGAVAVKIAARGSFPHSRSINWMEAESTTGESIVIKGKEYSGISTKGANYHLPKIVYDEHYATTHARINGLMTADFAGRTVRVSKWLLEEGITSEVVWSVSRPERFPWVEVTEQDGVTRYTREKELLSAEAFKDRLLERARKDNATLPLAKRVDISKMENYLARTDLVVVNRATTVPFRLSDLPVPFGERPLAHTSPKAEFMFMLNRMFAYLNQNRAEEQRFQSLRFPDKQAGVEERRAIEQTNDAEVTKFFRYFADNLAQQVGTLHKKGVAHGFLHAGNITADGTFVDIDSLHGSPLGSHEQPEAPITQADIVRDVAWVIRAIQGTTDELVDAGVLDAAAVAGISRRFLRQYAGIRWEGQPGAAADSMDRLMEDVCAYVPEEERGKKAPSWYDVRGRLQERDRERQLRRHREWVRREVAAPLRARMASEISKGAQSEQAA